MAKFRDSSADISVLEPAHERPDAPPHHASAPAAEPPLDAEGSNERSIGEILAEMRQLDDAQVERILHHQRDHGVRFGEAAVALGLASKDDVLFALAKQFNYPYAREEDTKLSSELVTLNEPFSTRSEHFRALRSQLMMRVFSGTGPRRALAVISPAPLDGKTYCAANLAITLAQLGGRTLLVDADMRGPRIHELFRLTNRSGLSSILSGRAEKDSIQQVAVMPSLFVLPVGTTPPNPLELVERSAFGLLMRELASRFEHVVVDTPAATHGADAGVIAARCGTALVIARRDSSRVDALQDLVAGATGSRVELAGVVVNQF